MGCQGRIQTGSYTNNDRQKVYTTDVVVESCEFVESKASQQPEENNNGFGPADENGFMNIPDDIDEELHLIGGDHIDNSDRQREKARAIKKIVETFDQYGINHPVSKLMVGDYMNYDNPR